VRGSSSPKSSRSWVRVSALTAEQKLEIGNDCDRVIAEVLTPRFLPRVIPTSLNYPILLHGKWRGSKYSFIARYRSGSEDDAGEEFDEAWLRLDYDEECLTETRFHIMWHRHTGQWFCLQRSVTVDEALRLIETKPLMRPPL
jgi:hypothetical protein